MPFQIDQRQQMCDALITLTQRSPIDKITIQNIVDQCGVTRTTFYRYFKDKYELLAYAFNNAALSIEEGTLEKGMTFFEFGVKICEMILDKKEFFRNAFTYEGQNSFFNSVCEYNKNAFRGRCEKGAREAGDSLDEDVLEYLSLGYGAGATIIYRQWVLSGMRETPEEISMMIYEACPRIYQDYL